MKKTIQALAAFLAVCTLATLFVGCADTPETDNIAKDTSEVTTKDENDSTEPSGDEQGTERGLRLKHDKLADTTYYCSAGIIYANESYDKFGVKSLDAKRDTGCIYYDAMTVGNYIQVATKEVNPDDLSTVNSVGLIDEEHNMIIPAEYARFRYVIDSDYNYIDRFVIVFKATGTTTNKDESIVSHYSKTQQKTIYYKGEWRIFDLNTGKEIPGIGSSKEESVVLYGTTFKYYDSNERTSMYYNEKGQKLPEKAQMLENGYCFMDKTVYNNSMEKLFALGELAFIRGDGSFALVFVEGIEDGVFRLEVDGKSYYVNSKGEDITEAYRKENFSYELKDGDIYTIDGGLLLEGDYKTAYNFGEYSVVDDKAGNIAVIHRKDKTVVYKAHDTSIKVMEDHFYKTVDGKNVYFSFKEMDFTIPDGKSSNENGLVITNNKEIYDIYTGEKIIDGYEEYSCVNVSDEVIYIIAKDRSGYNAKVTIYSYTR